MWWILLFAACGSCADDKKAPIKKVKTPKSAVVDWHPPSAEVLASDARAGQAALTQVAGAAASRPVPAKPSGEKADDIAVIVLDTTRADHFGLYGYTEGTTPKLDEWSKGARVWEHAYADAPWTLPSHASMFTGKCQREHGARSVDESDPRKAAPLAQSEDTIAEQMQRAGYRTVGVAGNPVFLNPAYGLSQGFDVWLNDQLAEDARGVPYAAADRVVPLALNFAEQKDDHPLFLFVNITDAHTPYKPRKGLVRESDALIRKSLPGNGGGFRKQSAKLLQGNLLDPAVIKSWGLAYDSELRWVDQNLADLLAGLDGIEHIFILGDHGEYLGEHRLVEHAKDVFEPVTHIPFIAKSPMFPAGRDDSLVQTHDIAWMVLTAAGLPVPEYVHHTKDFAESDLYFTLKKDLTNPDYGHRFNRIRRAFWTQNVKLIVDDQGSYETYDLLGDPDELSPKYATDLFTGIPEKYLAAHPEVPVVPLGDSPAEPSDELLKKLGYVE